MYVPSRIVNRERLCRYVLMLSSVASVKSALVKSKMGTSQETLTGRSAEVSEGVANVGIRPISRAHKATHASRTFKLANGFDRPVMMLLSCLSVS